MDNNQQIIKTNIVQQHEDNSGLQLCPIEVNADYRKKWKADHSDFLGMTYNGQLLNNNLYRVGGMGTRDIKNVDYFLILKYVEAYYSDEIIRQCGGNKRHLEGRWCIYDKFGVEKFFLATNH